MRQYPLALLKLLFNEKKNNMFRKKLTDYLANPVLGFVPFMLYAVLRVIMDEEAIPLIISFLVSVTGELYFRVFSRTSILGVPFLITSVALLLTFIIWVATRNYPISTNFYIIVCQIFIVGFCKLMFVSKSFLVLNFFRNRSSRSKTLMDNLYFVLSIIHPLMVTLLLFILALQYLRKAIPGLHALLETTLYTIIPIGIVAFTYIIYEIFRVRNLNMRLKREEWLPIVTENGDVIGKIAKSVSSKMRNKHLHPVVRIALVSDNKIYLQERENNRILDPGKLDYPFEKYVLFGHEIAEAVSNILKKVMGNKPCSAPQFILRYTFENEYTNRLILLFVVKVEREDIITRNDKMHGKFWTIKQIEESFKDEIFSECFELEYEYLKNKILLADDELQSQPTS